jgi:hypothetical protein
MPLKFKLEKFIHGVHAAFQNLNRFVTVPTAAKLN